MTSGRQLRQHLCQLGSSHHQRGTRTPTLRHSSSWPAYPHGVAPLPGPATHAILA